MYLRQMMWAAAVVAAFAATTAAAAPSARTLDRVTYTPPDGWKVDEGTPGQVAISRIGSDSYCLVAIYASAPASGDLDASFASEWKSVALRTIDPVAAPTPTQGNIGNARAALGGAASTIKGKPVAAILIVLDAGASIVSILILSPSPEAFEAYNADVQAMLGSLVVKRVDAPSAPQPPAGGGKLVVPPPARPLTVADLVGEWKHEDGITTTYVDRYTGAYAGYESLAMRETWTINAKGGINSDFFALRNGKKIVENKSGVISITGAVIDVKIGSPAKYVVRGWLDGPQLTVLKINGPWYGDIPNDVLSDPNKGWNLDKYWVRKAKSPPKPK